jgi:hypothetical protein
VELGPGLLLRRSRFDDLLGAEDLLVDQDCVAKNGLALGEQLGFGIHGIVFVADSHRETGPSRARSAIKALRRAPDYSAS